MSEYVEDPETGILAKDPDRYPHVHPFPGEGLDYIERKKFFRPFKTGSRWICPICKESFRLFQAGEYGEDIWWFPEHWWHRFGLYSKTR